MYFHVCEIFRSIQGESSRAGFPSLFIRLAGCNLNCAWCDTPYAKSGGETLSVDEIMSRVAQAGWFDHITVTGGEPLLQKSTPALISKLIARGYSVQVETNGSLDISCIPHPARKIVDVKCPSSGEQNSFLYSNFEHLAAGDELKFPIADENDFEYAKNFIEKHNAFLHNGIVLNVSPISGRMEASTLAEMLLSGNIAVRLNIQLHTVVWPKGEPKGT